MTSRKLSQLAWQVEPLWDWLGYNVGFNLRPRRTLSNFLVPCTRNVGSHWLNKNTNRLALRSTYVAYGKLREQITRAEWAPSHFVERYGELTRRLDSLLEAQYTALRLSESERVAVESSLPHPARRLTSAIEELQTALLAEAQLEQSNDTYGEIQRQFERHKNEQARADQDWRDLKGEYDEYMSSTRVNELDS